MKVTIHFLNPPAVPLNYMMLFLKGPHEWLLNIKLMRLNASSLIHISWVFVPRTAPFSLLDNCYASLQLLCWVWLVQRAPCELACTPQMVHASLCITPLRFEAACVCVVRLYPEALILCHWGHYFHCVQLLEAKRRQGKQMKGIEQGHHVFYWPSALERKFITKAIFLWFHPVLDLKEL